MTTGEEFYAEVAADAEDVDITKRKTLVTELRAMACNLENESRGGSPVLEVVALMRAAKIRQAADLLDDTRPKEAP